MGAVAGLPTVVGGELEQWAAFTAAHPVENPEECHCWATQSSKMSTDTSTRLKETPLSSYGRMKFKDAPATLGKMYISFGISVQTSLMKTVPLSKLSK